MPVGAGRETLEAVMVLAPDLAVGIACLYPTFLDTEPTDDEVATIIDYGHPPAK